MPGSDGGFLEQGSGSTAWLQHAIHAFHSVVYSFVHSLTSSCGAMVKAVKPRVALLKAGPVETSRPFTLFSRLFVVFHAGFTAFHADSWLLGGLLQRLLRAGELQGD